MVTCKYSGHAYLRASKCHQNVMLVYSLYALNACLINI